MSDPVVVALGLELSHGAALAVAASDFEIPSGQLTCLIGPNGSGKSTLLGAMAGLYPPRSGTITVLGSDPNDVRRRVAMVLQSTKVNEALPVSVAEVVAMGRYANLGTFGRRRAADRKAVREALDRLALGPLAHRRLPELSGGQRQRVFVAQGLAQDHDLLLLDEPLTGLDLISAAAIDSAIDDEISTGKTVVITSHDLSQATAAGHVLVLGGRVVASGPPAKTLTPSILEAAYGTRVMDGQVLIDDSAHRPSDRRHIHLDRAESTHSHDHP